MLISQRFRGVPFAGSIPAQPDNHVSYFCDRMTATKHLSRLFALLAVIAVLALILGQALGQPILLGYVATGSMEPTLEAGDGFIAVPSVLTGSASEGDVVVFDARTLHDGGLTTHRVVDVTDEGYHTHGDANPFTDQDGGEPPVSDGQIVAVALQVNGEVVRIPHLGTAVMTAHGAAETASGTVAGAFGLDSGLDAEGTGTVFVGIGVALLVFGLLLDHVGPKQRGLSRTRDRENVLSIWLAIAVVLIVLVTLASATMVVPSGVHEYGLISTDEPTDDPQVVAPGETAEVTRTIDNSGLLPVVVVVESAGSGVAADPGVLTVNPRSTAETSVFLESPETTGEYVRPVGEYRYIAVLPPSTLAQLHSLHPLVGIIAVNAVISGFAFALIVFLFGLSDLRIRSPGDHVSFLTRLQRKLPWWR